MKREKLIQQVKEIYSKLASEESQQHFIQSTTGSTPDAYYEKVLSLVIDEINSGTFDSFRSGQDIIDAVANDKTKWLSDWENNDLS